MAGGLEELGLRRRFSETLAGIARLHALRAGVHLGLFEALRQPLTEGQLAERLGLARDLVAGWLHLAHAHGFVKSAARAQGAYAISPFVRWLLDAPESASLLALLDQAAVTEGPVLERLPELMKGADRPTFGSPEEARRMAEGVRLHEGRALEALSRVPGAHGARRVLDVGCGYGTYLTGLLLRYRDAYGLGVEKDPEVAEEARRRLAEADVARRAEVRVGDFMTMDLPKGTFDLILLSNNLYYFPPAEHGALFRRARGRLAEGGVLAIQTPVATRGPTARLAGHATTVAAFDLFLRACRNLHALPDLRALHAALVDAGYDSIGETPILRSGAARYVWARASRQA